MVDGSPTSNQEGRALPDATPTPDFVTKNNGTRHAFTTGAVREVKGGKSRPDLIPPEFLLRLGNLYARGAELYGDRNWQKGQPLSWYRASAVRHFLQWWRGDTDEDHFSASIWNLIAFEWTKREIEAGRLPSMLNDLQVIAPAEAE